MTESVPNMVHNGNMKRLEAFFYVNASGKEPVREWLRKLSPEDRKIIGADIRTVEYGWPIGMPVCRPISSHRDLYEVRSDISSGRIARVLFIKYKGKMCLLHGFIKKSQATSKRDLDIADKRKREVKNG